MGLGEDIRTEVREIFSSQWTSRDGDVIPDTEDVKLGNDAVQLEAAVLYADLADSTQMVNTYKPHFAAEIYKAYLITACRVIRHNGGEITAFDGDRVMAVFIGDAKNSSAAITALKINWAVRNIVNEELKRQYSNTDFVVRHGVGIDTSTLWVARAGIRGSNDLVWVGRAANYAAKLCLLRSEPFVSWITEDVFNILNDSAKYGGERKLMWEKRRWNEYGIDVYCSSWWWEI